MSSYHSIGDWLSVMFVFGWFYFVLLAFFGFYPTVIIIIGLVVISITASIVDHYLKEHKRKNELCPHGIRGGKTLSLCNQCKKDEEVARTALLEEKAENERLGALKLKADNLRKQELIRLTKERYKDLQNLYHLSSKEFEVIVGELYKDLGYSVTLTPFSNDRGKDLIIRKNGKKFIVECKKYAPGKSIGRPALQKFFAAIAEEKAKVGYFITTSSFTKTAIQYAEENNIDLIDGNILVQMMKQAYQSEVSPEEYASLCRECGAKVFFNLSENNLTERICDKGHIVKLNIDINELTPYLLSDTVFCDKCGKMMRKIKGRYGEFYGCSGYPTCRNTKPITKHSRKKRLKYRYP